MKIVVCIKQVPDSNAPIRIEGGEISWGDAPLILNPWDEYALEAALRQKETTGGTVTVVTIGEEGTRDALKRALAMGADDALLVTGTAPARLDCPATARLLAAIIRKIGAVQMAFLGRQAIDDDSGLVAAQTARLLGWVSLTLAASITLSGNLVRVERASEEGRQVVSAELPAVFSVTKDFGEPRYPSFMGIRKAANAVIPSWSVTDLGIPLPEPVTRRVGISLPPSREVACEFITGSTPQQVAESLARKLLAEVGK